MELRLVWQYNNGISKNSNASNQRSKFRTKNWVEINDKSRGKYSLNRKINFKTLMLRSSLCDYSDTYILVQGQLITVNNTGTAAVPTNRNKKSNV